MSYNPTDYSCSAREAEGVYAGEFSDLAGETGARLRPWSDLSDDERDEFVERCVINTSASPDVYAEWGLRSGDLDALRRDVPGVFEG